MIFPNSENNAVTNESIDAGGFNSIPKALRKIIMWDKVSDEEIQIPYELSNQFRGYFLEDIKNAIDEINRNLKNCIQFR